MEFPSRYVRFYDFGRRSYNEGSHNIHSLHDSVKHISLFLQTVFLASLICRPMHVKILSEGSFLEDAGRLGNGEGGLDVRALPPCRSPPQEPDKHKDKDDAGKAKT